MDNESVNEILACMPQGKTRFDYFHDRYALLLLAWKAGNKISVSTLKTSSFSRLLHKPVVKSILAVAGDGYLSKEQLMFAWNEPAQSFLLSLSIWDGRNRWRQTSRRGENLVLQMNFTNQHRKAYQRLIKPRKDDLYIYSRHPVKNPGNDSNYRDTMAWARIDLDLDRGEALIEEIQNDWLRSVIADYRWAKRWFKPDELPLRYADCNLRELQQYHDEVLLPYIKIWDEAILSATLWFLRQEIGIHRVWYHHFETGAALKRISYTRPPRSLYTDLPKKFCFLATRVAPDFLQEDRACCKRLRKIENPQWFSIEL